MSDRVIKVVETPEELRLYQELIYQVYCQDLNWLEPNRYPQHRVADEYDGQSMHFLMLDGVSREVMAGMRLIRSLPAPLPIFDKFGEQKPTPDFFARHRCQPHPGREVEISRVAATKKFRSQGLQLTLDMVKAIFHYARENGLDYMYFTIDLSYFLFAHKIHVWIEPIGRPRFYQGSWVVPSVIFFGRMSQHLEQGYPEAFAYISGSDNIEGGMRDADLQRA